MRGVKYTYIQYRQTQQWRYRQLAGYWEASASTRRSPICKIMGWGVCLSHHPRLATRSQKVPYAFRRFGVCSGADVPFNGEFDGWLRFTAPSVYRREVLCILYYIFIRVKCRDLNHLAIERSSLFIWVWQLRASVAARETFEWANFGRPAFLNALSEKSLFRPWGFFNVLSNSRKQQPKKSVLGEAHYEDSE
jgi:hypothetical protein